jgi:hypothetical protein
MCCAWEQCTYKEKSYTDANFTVLLRLITFVYWEGRVYEIDFHILEGNTDYLRHYRNGRSEIVDISVTIYRNYCRQLLLSLLLQTGLMCIAK